MYDHDGFLARINQLLHLTDDNAKIKLADVAEVLVAMFSDKHCLVSLIDFTAEYLVEKSGPTKGTFLRDSSLAVSVITCCLDQQHVYRQALQPIFHTLETHTELHDTRHLPDLPPKYNNLSQTKKLAKQEELWTANVDWMIEQARNAIHIMYVLYRVCRAPLLTAWY